MNELFEHYYVTLAHGDSNDLEKNESGGYRYPEIGRQFAAFAAGVLLERAECQALCRQTAAAYPTSVWPDDGESKECAAAYMARLTARNIARAIDNRPGFPKTAPAAPKPEE